jgi:hypothetical protein
LFWHQCGIEKLFFHLRSKSFSTFDAFAPANRDQGYHNPAATFKLLAARVPNTSAVVALSGLVLASIWNRKTVFSQSFSTFDAFAPANRDQGYHNPATTAKLLAGRVPNTSAVVALSVLVLASMWNRKTVFHLCAVIFYLDAFAPANRDQGYHNPAANAKLIGCQDALAVVTRSLIVSVTIWNKKTVIFAGQVHPTQPATHSQ